MYRFFEKFPKEFGMIVVLFTMQQYIYNNLVEYVPSLEVIYWFNGNYSLVNGVTLIVGGFLANDYSDFRLRLRNTMLAIIAGGLLVSTNSVLGSSIGIIIFQIANCIFFISIFVRVATYIPSVNSLKIKSFLLISLLYNVPLMLAFMIELSFSAVDFTQGKIVLSSLILIAALYLIGKLKPSKIPKPIDGQKNSKFIFIFIAVIFISILGSLGGETVQVLVPEKNKSEEILFLLLMLYFIFFGGVLYWVFRKNKNEEIDVIKLLTWGFPILMLLYFLDFISFRFDYGSIISFTVTFSYFTYETLFVPILLTILTHNYLEQQKGAAIGAFFGFTFLGGYLFTINLDIDSYKYFCLIMVSIMLLIIPPILKNRKELEEVLRINQPHELEPSEEELEDPFDHLVQE